MSRTMSTSETLPLLTVTDISKNYGDTFALLNISLEIRKAEIVGLIGPNGAGKTTLLECIAGLIPYDAGTLTWQQELLECHSRNRLFYLADQIQPYPEQYVIHVLNFFASLYRTPRDQAIAAMSTLELEPVLAKRVETLSKGYRKRLLLCIMLLANQPLLMLDEPFDGLDLRQTKEAMRMLRNLRCAGKSMLVSIHQISDAEKICDRFILLSNGMLIGAGNLDELRSRASIPQGSLEEVFLALA